MFRSAVDSDTAAADNEIAIPGTQVPMRVVARPGALDDLAAILDSAGRFTRVALLTDDVPKTFAGGDVLDSVRRALPAGVTTRQLVVHTGDHGVTLDEATVDSAVAQAAGADLVLGVGSGTIGDLAKQLGATLDVPVILVQTAASVNGYSDSLSVLVRSGAKRTVPSTWPHTLIIDHDILAGAPDRLTRAGVGDAIAAWCAPADWYLACATGLDPAAYRSDSVDAVLSAADRLGAVDPETPSGLAALAETLTLGGLAIGVTGTTATLSGTEHLVSHLLDMAAMARGTEHDLHGAQVGVASVVSAALWEVSLDELDLGAVDPDASGTPADLEPAVLSSWSVVDESGQVGQECLAAVHRKAATWEEQRSSGALRRVWSDWARHESALRSLVRTPEEIAAVLHRWGAPTRFRDLTPTVDEDRVRWVLRTLPLMRDRFTLTDVLYFTGRWDDAIIDRVLERAAAAGGGL